MVKYIIVRTVWIFIVLITILSLNYTLLKLAPEYPPTTEEARGIYYARQVADGYMTERVIDDPTEVQSIRDGEVEFCSNCWAKLEVDSSDNYQFRIYEPVPIVVQYCRWFENFVCDWNWGYSTRVAVNVPVFDVLKDRLLQIRLVLRAVQRYDSVVSEYPLESRNIFQSHTIRIVLISFEIISISFSNSQLIKKISKI